MGGMARRGGTWLTVDSLQGPRQFEPSSGESSGESFVGRLPRGREGVAYFGPFHKSGTFMDGLGARPRYRAWRRRWWWMEAVFFPQQMQGRQRAGRVWAR